MGLSLKKKVVVLGRGGAVTSGSVVIDAILNNGGVDIAAYNADKSLITPEAFAWWTWYDKTRLFDNSDAVLTTDGDVKTALDILQGAVAIADAGNHATQTTVSKMPDFVDADSAVTLVAVNQQDMEFASVNLGTEWSIFVRFDNDLSALFGLVGNKPSYTDGIRLLDERMDVKSAGASTSFTAPALTGFDIDATTGITLEINRSGTRVDLYKEGDAQSPWLSNTLGANGDTTLDCLFQRGSGTQWMDGKVKSVLICKKKLSATYRDIIRAEFAAL